MFTRRERRRPRREELIQAPVETQAAVEASDARPPPAGSGAARRTGSMDLEIGNTAPAVGGITAITVAASVTEASALLLTAIMAAPTPATITLTGIMTMAAATS